jgi:hypothetical protein
VPVLIVVAVATLVFGTDHPNGKWASSNGDLVRKDGISHDTPRVVPTPLQDSEIEEEKGKNVAVEVLTVTSGKMDAGELRL